MRRGGLILYVHGFASCGWGGKSRSLARHFGADRVLAPDLPHDPDEAIALLESLRAERPIGAMVGSSLGAYYTLWLNRGEPIPAVLVNPAMEPWIDLARAVGSHRRWCDGAPLEFHARHLARLEAMRRTGFSPQERYLVLLQTGDELLDWRVAAAALAPFDVVVEHGGSHRMENFPDYLPRIAAFLAAGG
jgi:hypothetical protein